MLSSGIGEEKCLYAHRPDPHAPGRVKPVAIGLAEGVRLRLLRVGAPNPHAAPAPSLAVLRQQRALLSTLTRPNGPYSSSIHAE